MGDRLLEDSKSGKQALREVIPHRSDLLCCSCFVLTFARVAVLVRSDVLWGGLHVLGRVSADVLGCLARISQPCLAWSAQLERVDAPVRVMGRTGLWHRASCRVCSGQMVVVCASVFVDGGGEGRDVDCMGTVRYDKCLS